MAASKRINICITATHGQMRHVFNAIQSQFPDAPSSMVKISPIDLDYLKVIDIDTRVRIWFTEPLTYGTSRMHADMSRLLRCKLNMDLWLMVGACMVQSGNSMNAAPNDLIIPEIAYYSEPGSSQFAPSVSFLQLVRSLNVQYDPLIIPPSDSDIFLRYVFARDFSGSVSKEFKAINDAWLDENGFPNDGPLLSDDIYDRFINIMEMASDRGEIVYLDSHGYCPTDATTDKIQTALAENKEFPETRYIQPKTIFAECVTSYSLDLRTNNGKSRLFAETNNVNRYPLAADCETAAFLQQMSMAGPDVCYGVILDVFYFVEKTHRPLCNHASNQAILAIILAFVAQ
jgi:hypothetical protein